MSFSTKGAHKPKIIFNCSSLFKRKTKFLFLLLLLLLLQFSQYFQQRNCRNISTQQRFRF